MFFCVKLWIVGDNDYMWICRYQKLMKNNRCEGPSQETQSETQSVASGTSVNRWPRIGAPDFTSFASQAQHVRAYFGRAQDLGTKASRKLRALWELAS